MFQISFPNIVLSEITLLGVFTILFFSVVFFSFRDSIAVLIAFYPTFFIHPFFSELIAEKILPFIHPVIPTFSSMIFIYLISLCMCIVIFRAWTSFSISPRLLDTILLTLAFVLLYSIAFFNDSLNGLFAFIGIEITSVFQQIASTLPFLILFFVSIT